MSVYAFLQISTESRLSKTSSIILIWANREKISVDEFVQIQVQPGSSGSSSR